jgi:two-component system, LuxR family, sensor kinase FixL
MVIVHAAAAFKAVLVGLTLAPFGRRRSAQDEPGAVLAPNATSAASAPVMPVPHAAPIERHTTAHAAPADAALCATLERMPLAMLILAANGRIAYANGSAQALFGYTPHELHGMCADRILPGAGDALASRRDTARHDETLFAHRQDRTSFPADLALSALEGSDAALTLAVVIDRSGRDELQRNRQELAHLTRVSMLGELAASLGHELNQPLTAILSNAQAAQRFMSREPLDLFEMREILSDLVADTNRASEILRRIRALVKKGELELAPVSIAGVIGDVALLVHSDAIQRGIRVAIDLETPLPPVRGDKIQLQQVVLNLLLNAFEAMECCTVERVVTVSAARDGDERVRVSVRDRGHGLPPALADDLFKPFCTSRRDGLGLGLSISRSIVDMHGGRIWAADNADRGATFSFTLPTDHAASVRDSR